MSVISFPHWKHANATPAEKLYELAEYATRHPEDVKSLILLWQNEDEITTVEADSTLRTDTAVYMLEQTKFNLLK